MSTAEATLAPDEPRSPAPPRVGHRPDIQGLRAVAILLVVTYHASIPAISGGFIGVDVFFVVSGFVITQMLLREQRKTERIALSSFYLRRARRILPALAVLTTLVMVLSIGLGSVGAQTRTLGTGIAASLFAANIYLVTLGKGGYFHADASTNPLLHTWSLSLEEQFYMVFPALLVGTVMMARRRQQGRPPFAPVVALMSLASFALCWVTTNGLLPDPRLHDEFAFFMAPTRVWQFGAGALLAIGAARVPSRRWAAEAFGWAGLALVAWSATAFDESTLFPGAAAAVPTLGTVLLIAAGTSGSSSLTRALSIRPMTAIGDLSYSWYLWHWPAIVFCAALVNQAGTPALVLAATSSLVPAWLSYRWVEQPIRHGTASPARTIRMAAVCIGVPVMVGVALVPVSRVVDRSSAVADFRQQTRLHADAVRGCTSGRTEVPSERCTWPVDPADGGAPSAAGGVGNVLVGDSNAGQFSEAFIEASNAQGRDATVQTKSSCPFADLTAINGHVRDDGCRRFVASMVDALVAAEPDHVVISVASDRYIEDPTITLVQADGHKATTPADKARAWEAGLGSVVDELAAAGIPVTVVMPIPKFAEWDPHECATGRVLLDASSCATSADHQGLLDRRARAVAAQTRIVDDRPAAVGVIDPFDTLCPDDPCATFRDDTWWWRDGNHVTISGARATRSLFDEALARG